MSFYLIWKNSFVVVAFVIAWVEINLEVETFSYKLFLDKYVVKIKLKIKYWAGRYIIEKYSNKMKLIEIIDEILNSKQQIINWYEHYLHQESSEKTWILILIIIYYYFRALSLKAP